MRRQGFVVLSTPAGNWGSEKSGYKFAFNGKFLSFKSYLNREIFRDALFHFSFLYGRLYGRLHGNRQSTTIVGSISSRLAHRNRDQEFYQP